MQLSSVENHEHAVPSAPISTNLKAYETMEISRQSIISRANEFINSDNFFDGANLFINQHIYVFSNYKYAAKFISDEGRYLVTIKQTSALLASSSEFERTAQALYNFAVQNKLATKSRVAAGLAIAVLGNYLTWETSPNDKRMKVFTPLPKFMALAEDTFYSYSRALLAVDPEKYRLLSTYTPRMAGEMAGASVEVYIRGRRLAESISGLAIFSHRDGGFEILTRIMQEARFFSEQRRNVIMLPYNAVAKQFGISRSQTQKTFAAAADSGFIRLRDKGGKMIEILPAFHSFATEVIANMLALASVSYELVLKKLEAEGVSVDTLTELR